MFIIRSTIEFSMQGIPYGASSSDVTTTADNHDLLSTNASKPASSNSFRMSHSIFRLTDRPGLNTSAQKFGTTAMTNTKVSSLESVPSVIPKSPRSPRHVSHPQAYQAKGQFLIDLQKIRSDKYDVDLNTIIPPSNPTITNTSNTMMESISHTRLNFSVHIVRCFL